MRGNRGLFSVLGVVVIALYLSHLTENDTFPLQFYEPDTVQPGSLYNVHLRFLDKSFEGPLHIVYGDCNLRNSTDAHHELGTISVKRGAYPDRLLWIIPLDTPSHRCLSAFSNSLHAGRSSPITVTTPSDPLGNIARLINASNAWFDGTEYIRAKQSIAASESSKNASIAIIGGGMAGLMTSHLLDSVGLHDWHIYESSQRLGGRVRTVYLNDTKPDDYQYQEMGAMRIPVEIQYIGTDEPLPFQDHQLVIRLADVLNRENAHRNPELHIQFIPFKVQNPKLKSTVQTEADSHSDKYIRNVSSLMFKAHKEALKDGKSHWHWSEGGYLRYALGSKTNISNYIASNDTSPIWESLYSNDFFSTTSWQTIDKGFESLPRAFYPHVVNKTSLHSRVDRLTFNQTSNKISVHWIDDQLQDQHLFKRYDYVVVAAPFSKVRLWETPAYSPILRRAITDLPFEQSCKVALLYKTRFWEHTEHPIYGGCETTDIVPGIGDICYPSYAINATGPGVILATYNHGNMARSTAALSTEEHVALAQRAMIRLHGKIANEQFQGDFFFLKILALNHPVFLV
jgi:monoamine oxidase